MILKVTYRLISEHIGLISFAGKHDETNDIGR